MPYSLHYRRVGQEDLKSDRFATIPDAINAALNVKAACTDQERRELAMWISDDDDTMVVTTSQIEDAYKTRRVLGSKW